MDGQTLDPNPSAPSGDQGIKAMDSSSNTQQNRGHPEDQSGQRPSHCGRGRDGDRGRGRGNSRGRGGRRGHGGHGEKSGRYRNKDVGRAEWSRNQADKRARNDQNQLAAKRRRIEGKEEVLPVYATKFSKEEIEAQEKKPKRKVAVMIGYSGSGYKGMQLNHQEKTIEGDLFSAFVAAGAISKANADDPKKSSLIRCARTDKGVHAAGNLISLKLIVEDPDIVTKINDNLSPQIRVWGIERTNGSFSAYQFCDSRIYEYLIPTHCFLPPHPKSFLAEKMIELAKEAGDLEGYSSRQQEVAEFWSEAEDTYVKPVIDSIAPSLRESASRVFYEHEMALLIESQTDAAAEAKQAASVLASELQLQNETADSGTRVSPDRNQMLASEVQDQPKPAEDAPSQPSTHAHPKELTPLEAAVRLLKDAHVAARKAYRIHPARLARVRSALSRFEGSQKYHNYTIEKSFKDPSATRIIKTFQVDEKPIVIGDTEWLSLKVHGQSFMMHQIRKMVSMVALMVRCGCHEGRLQDSYTANRLSIPKAPSLGLLLERPVFEIYNEKLEQFGREKIDFSRHDKEMEEFKQREIYERIFREEERDGTFHSFFTGLDHTKSAQLFYLSSMGIEAIRRGIPRPLVEVRDKTNVEQISSDEEGGDSEEG